MSGLVFAGSGDRVLKIDVLAQRKLEAHVQLEPDAPEAGGVLLGRWLAHGLCFVVDDISEPTPDDRRTRTSFFRSGPAHMLAVGESLRRSGDTRGYLGEWHTHPEPVPTPSGVDLRDWQRRLHLDQVELPCTFFVIVGTAALRVWVGLRPRGPIAPLKAVRFESDPRGPPGHTPT